MATGVWELMQNWRSPGFEVNDLAYLDRADYKWMNANIGRQWTVPTSWYRSINTIVGGQQQFTYDGLKNDEELHAFYAMRVHELLESAHHSGSTNPPPTTTG